MQSEASLMTGFNANTIGRPCPMRVFFDLYYGENSAGGTSKAGEQHIEDLRLSQSMLMQHYPDCAPLRDLVGKIDLAVISLEKLR